jgi:hypothetical protein
MKKLLLLLLLLLGSGWTVLSAQDTLFTRQGDARLVKITEIGLEEIKYTVWNLEASPVVVIARSEVRKIVFSNGEVMNFTPDLMAVENQQNLAAGKVNAIKVEFFSPLSNNLTFGYERVIRPGFNLEAKLGIIGVGLNTEAPDAAGVFIKIGPKYWSGKDYYVRGMRMSHPLRGIYIRPEFIFSQFTQTQTAVSYSPGVPNENVKVNYTNIAANICFGKQVLLGSQISLDYYIGIGYGWQDSNYNGDLSSFYFNDDLEWESYAYSHLYFGRNFPMIMSGGLTLGYIF